MPLHLKSQTVMGAVGLFTATAVMAQADPGDGPYYGHYGMMSGGGWFYGSVMMLLFFGLLVGAVVLIVRLVGAPPAGPGSGQVDRDRALSILRERFARGEIDKETFEASRKVLDGDTT
ncbi:SHOCT domain-containing protein [Oceanibium sediminis]|uniref:SHOCT domain-containing protein n=1 Tax=Oceanibium sediminis TaxID=2026339 RepID=UPI001E5E5002|nr:SHOCT domain-containing protein [Oceanibium sediminis]